MPATVHCLNDHVADMPEVDYLGEGRKVVGCEFCHDEFVVEDDGALTPVRPSVMVAEAIADEDRLGWGSTRERALSSDPYWGRLDA